MTAVAVREHPEQCDCRHCFRARRMPLAGILLTWAINRHGNRRRVADTLAKRGRGRPKMGATAHDLRDLPPWARRLVILGMTDERAQHRYGGETHRAEYAALGAMVRAGWSDEKIAAAFTREDWFIGVKFRSLIAEGAYTRAATRLARQLETLRASGTNQPAASTIKPSSPAIEVETA